MIMAKKMFVLLSVIAAALTVINVVMICLIGYEVNTKLNFSYFADLEAEKAYRFAYLNDSNQDDSDLNDDFVQLLTPLGEIDIPYWNGSLYDEMDVEAFYDKEDLMMVVKFKDNPYDINYVDGLNESVKEIEYFESEILDNGIRLGKAVLIGEDENREVSCMYIGERVYMLFDETQITCEEMAMSLKP